DVDGIFRLAGGALNQENQVVAFKDESITYHVEENGDDAPSADTARSLHEKLVTAPISSEPEELATPRKRDATERPASGMASHIRGGPVVRRFTKRNCAPDPFGMGHLGVERVRHVECRSMGSLAKKAKENADEAIFETKKHAAEALKVNVGKAKQAQEQATSYAREATKWAAEASEAADAVRWTQAVVEAAEIAVKDSDDVEMRASEEFEELKASEVYHVHDLGVEDPDLDEEAARAMEVAARAVEAAAVAKQMSERNAPEELGGSDDEGTGFDVLQAGGYRSPAYSSGQFFGSVAKKLKLEAAAKRTEARSMRGPGYPSSRTGQARSPAYPARRRREAARSPSTFDVVEAVKAAGQAVEAAAQAMERAERAKALGEDTGEQKNEAADVSDVQAEEHGGFFDSIAQELRELAVAAKQEADKEASLAKRRSAGQRLFGSGILAGGTASEAHIKIECLMEPTWQAARQEAEKTAMEAARLAKEAQAAALGALQETGGGETLDFQELAPEADIDDGGYRSTEYSSRKFGSRIKNKANKTKEAAQTAARKAQEAAKKARSTPFFRWLGRGKLAAEKIAKETAQKSAEAAKKAQKAADKAAKAVAAAALDAKKAGELVTKEVAEEAQKAAAAAKQVAEDAQQVANKAVDEVGDVAGDVANVVKDVANDVKDGVVHAAHKVKDAAEDAAEVVGDVTMKVVEVVEEVVEEVWEHTPAGLKRVARKIVKVIKKGVDFVVKIGKVVYHFVETKLEQLVKALDWVWNQIKTGIMNAIEWLASYFKYDEILETAALLESAALFGLDEFIATIPSQGDVKEFFDELRQMLKLTANHDLEAEDTSAQGTVPDREVDPKEHFILHHSSSGTFDQSVPPADAAEDSQDQGSSEERDDSGNNPGVDSMAEKLQHLFEKLKEGLNAFMVALTEGVIDLVEGGALAMVEVLKYAANAIRDWFADGGPVYIPVISEIYKLVTGRKLKFAKALFFMIAIPVTYMSKVLFGKWPSQLLIVELLSSADDSGDQDLDSTSTGAPAHMTRSLTSGDESSSEFAFTSREVKHKRAEAWACLKGASIFISAMTITMEGDAMFADLVIRTAFIPALVLIQNTEFLKVIQKLLNFAGSMLYVKDYFKGSSTPLTKADKGIFVTLKILEFGGIALSMVSLIQVPEGLSVIGPQSADKLDWLVLCGEISAGLVDVAKGSRLIVLSNQFESKHNNSRQKQTMRIEGSTKICQGLAQIGSVGAENLPHGQVRTLAIGFTFILQFGADVVLEIASVALQMKGSDSDNDPEQQATNRAYWIACFAYM
ncbi:unnamed protein product, partial [Hapterophycus canaliculatus]